MTVLNLTELGKLTKDALGVKGIELDSKESKTTVETVFEVIRDRLLAGDDIDIYGFGKLENKSRAARKGRNPQTGVEIDIEEKRTVGLKLKPKFKEQLNS
ncbi:MULTISPECIES: HU family DNA-binding protein [Lysinibacillus]|uniref:HU family DNA-binding protein n=1 Tax=Lysinibacillus TaxID=400634 RepID=UPI00214B754F|nr:MULTISPECIES: HU family DNA-binding protein [Lysinibacillus]UUV25873.1 HU family DNA-binding protein [Lysinibacillus sp. FN11]UYB48746.1 HU family DNA-binding protein [Lysinibacillus capsici]